MRSAPLKRALDLVVATSALVLLSPVLALAAIAVRVRHGAPVLFRQVRPGLHGALFEMRKLRTMTDERDPSTGELLPDADRLTRLGRVLRSTSIDELPALVNVLRGEMSIVGPRPLLPRYVDLYTPEQARRMEVKPGITGLAQVRGRNALTWEERFALDVEYVDTWSVAGDLRLMAQTVLAVVKRDGISADGHVTMQPFTGTRQP